MTGTALTELKVYSMSKAVTYTQQGVISWKWYKREREREMFTADNIKYRQ